MKNSRTSSSLLASPPIYQSPSYLLFITCFEHIVLETCNKSYYKTRIYALSWLITKIIPRCTVSKTSKFSIMFINGISVRYEGDWYIGGDARRLDEVLLFFMPLG